MRLDVTKKRSTPAGLRIMRMGTIPVRNILRGPPCVATSVGERVASLYRATAPGQLNTGRGQTVSPWHERCCYAEQQ